MKDLFFIALLIVLGFLALKVFLWALKSVLLLGIVLAVLYLVYRTGIVGKLFGRSARPGR
jgi:hypothetical protein